MENLPRRISAERQQQDLTFSLKLLSSRHEIESMLYDFNDYSGEFTAEGFSVDAFTPPQLLDSFLRPFEPASFDLTASRHPNGTVTYHHLFIQPLDGAPLSIERHDSSLATLRQSDTIIGPVADSAIESVLRQLVPAQVRTKATQDQLLRFFESNSPTNASTIERSNSNGTVSFSRVETVDNSMETLAITNESRHISDSDVRLRMLLCESLNRRHSTADTQLDHTERSLILEVKKGDVKNYDFWTIEELLDKPVQSPTFDIDTATRQHMKKLTDTLHSVVGKSFTT